MDTDMRNLHALLSSLLALASFAQQWCVPGATWHYSDGWGSDHYTKYVYTGDTLIEGVVGNIIRFNVSDGPWIYPTYVTRAEDDVIYRLQDFSDMGGGPQWDTIIWFGADPGDHWDQLQLGDFGCSCPFNVVDTGHVEFGGQWLRSIDVSNPCFKGGSQYRYIERIGSEFGLFFDDCWGSGFFFDPTLRCFSDEGMDYTSGLTPSCDWGVGMNAESDAAPMTIHLLNAGTILVEGLPRTGSMEVQFIDAAGRILLAPRLPPGERTIAVGGLASGCYIVRVLDGPNIRTMRWLKP